MAEAKSHTRRESYPVGYGSFYLYAMSWYDKLLPSILRFDTRSSVKSMSMLGHVGQVDVDNGSNIWCKA